ncbi:MAG: hypothetical protein IJZ96_00230 [Lachnospiraceae bacterium]|nr:hypothetical protein [Lachnospiraceae bacterium]MBQ8317297.1 hypothetical protein [Lachnospiraceae bacterium]
MKTVTICGSMRFAEEMKDIALQLEISHDMNVIQCIYNSHGVHLSDDDMKQIVETHYKKIELSDAIYVVNIDGYIGESVRKEIEYAERNGIEVIYHTEFSKCM